MIVPPFSSIEGVRREFHLKKKEVFMHKLLIDLTGKKFGRLTVIERFDNKIPVRWLCICECGCYSHPSSQNLRSGLAVSCGCSIKKKLCNGLRSKGRKKYKKLYKVWDTMKQRCTNPNHNRYHVYGGRGIEVCEEWANSFDIFFEEFGFKWKEGMCIDRIDNDSGYCKDNCRWVSLKENSNNTSKNIVFELDGFRGTLTNLCENFGFKYKRVYQNLVRTKSFEKAIEIERRHHGKH